MHDLIMVQFRLGDAAGDCPFLAERGSRLMSALYRNGELEPD
jgi:hypothetical protein